MKIPRVPSRTARADPTILHDQRQSPLMRLPYELILLIFEYVVVEDDPLLLNCGCDSSYTRTGGRGLEAYKQDRELWHKGELHPPIQPMITRTCSLIRAITIKIFYQRNAFRACYCYGCQRQVPYKWLAMIGSRNRRMIRDLCFWDWNAFYDKLRPDDLVAVRRSKIFREWGGSMETVSTDLVCCHRITFGGEGGDYYHLVPALFEPDIQQDCINET